MRLLILLLVLVNAVLMVVPDLASAQSPYSYPWCGKLGRGARTCYFNSREECMTWSSAKGAYCYPNLFYPPRAATRR
jgi:hypothetical protein